MTTVVRSEKEIIVGAAEEKIKAVNPGIGAEEIEGVPVTGEADTEPQLPEHPQDGANGHNLEKNKNVLNLIES